MCGFPWVRRDGRHADFCGDPAIFGEPDLRKPPSTLANCGKYTGVDSHRLRGERPCEPCREALNVYRRAQFSRLGAR